ncbi:hypothetical protein CEXT_57691 [Caerostris extrusa]|uniref:Uncharacterized protein n=1 Tax=Caerostris extrusa TaxID=172846 RepID=A0AAV4VET2_CAEEX|nr:hypothetical protein CEXT_57691 [Caerostris extrusa]
MSWSGPQTSQWPRVAKTTIYQQDAVGISLFLPEPKLLGFPILLLLLRSHEEENRLSVASVSFFGWSNNIPEPAPSPGFFRLVIL